MTTDTGWIMVPGVDLMYRVKHGICYLRNQSGLSYSFPVN